MDYKKRLYMVLYPNQSLIASHLDPDMFARHYTSGSSRHYSGKLIFAEVDKDYRNDFFDIENVLKDLKSHSDGRPKATKFIASYRVLENVELSALGNLYISTEEGHCVGIEKGGCKDHQEGFVRVYAEIAPMRMLVMSRLTPTDFGKRITDSSNNKSAPAQFFTQLDFNPVEFVKEFEKNPFKPSPIPSMHPSTIRDGFNEMMTNPDKRTKGMALDSNMDTISYRLIRNGFTFASKGECLFYPIPSTSEIESMNLKFWRTM